MTFETTAGQYRDRFINGDIVYLIDDRNTFDPIVKKGTITQLHGWRGYANVRLWPSAMENPDNSGMAIAKWPRDLFTHGEVMEAVYGDDAFEPLELPDLADIDETIDDPLMNRSIMLNNLGAIAIDRIGDDYSDRISRNR